MEQEKVIVEKAKDGNYTCKMSNENGTWSYVYSKYKPCDNINVNINTKKEHLLLGLGLGYELKILLEKTTKDIYVVDKDRTFFEKISQIDDLNNVLKNSRVKFYFGNEYEKISKKQLGNCHLIYNHNITKYNMNYFLRIINLYIESNKINELHKKVLFFEHITIADDCMDALRNMGFDVIKRKISYDKSLIDEIITEKPDYIFTINLDRNLYEICEKVKIPYIAWIVDTPFYTLYEKIYKYKYGFIFIYDENIAEEMKQKGCKNIFYMPVAVNVNRLNKIRMTEDDIKNYSADVSFIGSSGIQNEYNNAIKNKLSIQTREYIENIFKIQWENRNKFIIDKYVNEHLINSIEQEAGYKILGEQLLSRESKLSFLLARKFNEIERINTVEFLSNYFDVNIYGDDTWNLYDRIKYRGYAEHFCVMPKIFKLSKININITRVYVESGLPMRVFDIIGSKGFLVTNYKKDISRYFTDGEHLVIYRDAKDLKEILQYYLNHEDERQRIISQGYTKIKTEHNYEKRLKQMIQIVDNGIYGNM